MELSSQEKISRAFYVLKAFCIFSVAAAHCIFTNPQVQRLSSLIGTIGVPSFLIASGYYFRPSDSWKELILKKGKRLVIPWLLYGMATFVYSLQSWGGFSILDAGKWVCGYHTWLYYVPVLLVCILIFQQFNHTGFCIFTVFISIISIICTGRRGLAPDFIIIDRQNALNWVGYFAIGILLGRYQIIDWFIKNRGNWLICLSVSIPVCIIYSVFCPMPTYWTDGSFFFAVASFAVLLSLAYQLRDSRFLLDIGKATYFIFFVHMQIGGAIVRRLLGAAFDGSGQFGMVICFVRPALVVLVTYGLFLLLRLCLKAVKCEKFGWIFAA